MNPLSAPDPFEYRSLWAIRVDTIRSFDLLVARQLLWLPHARPAVRSLLFAPDDQPICIACSRLIATGDASVISMAVLADLELQEKLAVNPNGIAARDPDGREAWWLLHGDCFDKLTPER